jgi:hypothetical protein
MKWRTTLIYFLVLLLVGAVYVVVEKKQKEAARVEKESKRVFAFDLNAVKEIEVRSGDLPAIHLEKGEDWRITQPVASDVDRMMFGHFFSVLRSAERERKIDKPSDNLAAFGLDKPSFVIRLLSGGEWFELQVGAKTPTESSRYARTGNGSDVFMMSGVACDDLNKGLKDLRTKELFGWLPDQVGAVEVKWRSGEGLDLERQAGAEQWKCVTQPEVVIKAKKVQDLLDEVHWLRAVDFIGQDAMPPDAEVEVKVKLKDGRTADLKVAAPDQAKKRALATSSEIGPVLIASHILEAIPKSAASLADRSLISLDAADIVQVTFKAGDEGGNLVRLDSKTWGTKEGEASAKPVEDSLQVRRFLTSLENVEYMEAVEPAPNPPEGAPNSVGLVDAVGKKNSLVWERLPSEAANQVTVWIEKEGAARAVNVKYEDLKRLNESLAQLASGVQGKHYNQ